MPANAPPPPPLLVHSRAAYWGGRTAMAVPLAVACGTALRTSTGASAALGIVGLALFGGFALYGLRRLLRRGPRLSLSAAGVDAVDLGIGAIPWSAITHAEAFGSHAAPFVAFHVAAPGALLARLPVHARVVARLHRASGLPTVSINLIGTDASASDVVRCARAFLARAARTGESGPMG